MKHKFGLNLPHLRIPSKAENRALRDLLEGLDNLSPLTPPLSPFINRRQLDLLTEAQLKAACAAVVKGDLVEQEPKLNFKPLHATKNAFQPIQSSEEHRQRPQTSSHVLPKQIEASAASYAHMSRNVTSSKGAYGPGQVSEHPRRSKDKRQYAARDSTSPAHNAAHRPQTAPLAESDVSCSTPQSASTDRIGNISTAMTSAAMSPSRRPGQLAHAALADVSVTSTTYGVSEPTQPRSTQQVPQTVSTHNGQSLSASLEKRSGFRNWMRSDRRNTIRPTTATVASPGSNHIYQQASSKTTSSKDLSTFRPSSESIEQGPGGRSDQANTLAATDNDHQGQLAPRKSKVNLNRRLPPLPSIHTWKGHTENAAVLCEPAPSTVQGPYRHLAHLVKTGNYDSSLPHHSDEIPRYKQGVAIDQVGDDALNDGDLSGRSITSERSSHDSCFTPAARSSRIPSRNVFYNASENMRNISKSSTSLHGQVDRDISTASQRRTTHSSLSSNGVVPNFSRKISLDAQGGIRRAEILAELATLPPIPRKEQPTGLRKVLSRFDISQSSSKQPSKKESKPLTWMDVFEAEGIKTGVMIERPAAGMPIVRY